MTTTLRRGVRGPARRRVVITGMGAVTPLGHTMAATWQGVLEGRRVAGAVKRFDASGFPTTFAYEVGSDFALDAAVQERACGDAELVLDPWRYGIAASAEALAAAGLPAANVDASRFALSIGVGMLSPDLAWYDRVFLDGNWQDPSMRVHGRFFPDTLTAMLARLAGARGESSTVHTACASSGQALADAFEMIAYGDADVVLTGGVDSMVSPFYLAGFSLLGALSKRNDDPLTASRPFDKDRDGFVLGEGAAMLVFEEESHARARGARILCEIAGAGVTESAYRITDLHPEGVGPIEAMQEALDTAGIAPESVGYVNAHGTGTALNDRIEALAVSRVFPADRCNVVVGSTKSMTGHMISAAGAVELAFCAQALVTQTIPPNANVFTPDPECQVTLAGSKPESRDLECALSNSVGFGGSNTALLVRRIAP